VPGEVPWDREAARGPDPAVALDSPRLPPQPGLRLPDQPSAMRSVTSESIKKSDTASALPFRQGGAT